MKLPMSPTIIDVALKIAAEDTIARTLVGELENQAAIIWNTVSTSEMKRRPSSAEPVRYVAWSHVGSRASSGARIFFRDWKARTRDVVRRTLRGQRLNAEKRVLVVVRCVFAASHLILVWSGLNFQKKKSNGEKRMSVVVRCVFAASHLGIKRFEFPKKGIMSLI